MLNGVLWILGTGSQWRELPDRYPPFQTCHRRFQQWVRSGRWNSCYVGWHGNCTSAANSILRKLSLMRRSPPRKKGPCSRPNAPR